MKILRESSLPTMKGQSFFDVFNEKNEEEISIAELKSYKLSKYNIIESFDTSVIVYNTASDGICQFESNEVDGLFDIEDLSKWNGNEKVLCAFEHGDCARGQSGF